jgi:hypothetical protein
LIGLLDAVEIKIPAWRLQQILDPAGKYSTSAFDKLVARARAGIRDVWSAREFCSDKGSPYLLVEKAEKSTVAKRTARPPRLQKDKVKRSGVQC